MIFIDMDGVIVNLGETLTDKVLYLLENPDKIKSKRTFNLVNRINNHEKRSDYNINLDFMKDIFIKKDTVGLNKFEKLVSRLSYKPLIGDSDLWANLPKEEGADELISFLSFKYGKDNLRILSAPVDDDSIMGKREWLKIHFPFLLDTASFEANKYIYSAKGRLLIDDRPKNITLWREKGGIGILHKDVTSTIQTLS